MKVDMEIKMTKEEKQAITTIVNMFNQLSDGEESFLDEYLRDMQVPYVQDIKEGLLELREIAEDIEEQPKEFSYE
jgi:hypothetical protein